MIKVQYIKFKVVLHTGAAVVCECLRGSARQFYPANPKRHQSVLLT